MPEIKNRGLLRDFESNEPDFLEDLQGVRLRLQARGGVSDNGSKRSARSGPEPSEPDFAG